MSYHRQHIGNHVRHACVFVGILFLHLVAIQALWSGLTNPGVSYVPTSFQIDVISAEKPQVPPARFSPVNLKEYAAIQVATPEIDIPVAEDLPPPVQVTGLEKELPESLDPPALQAAPSIPNVRPRPIHVPGGRDRYPVESIRARESGAPTITICISATGAVDSVKVNESSGFPRLDQAAINIGKEAIFRPARLHDKPVPFCAPYRITFKIGNS